jgi:hypothetical protein
MSVKTIGQMLELDSKVDYPLCIKDSKNREIYYEDSNNNWIRRKYDKDSNLVTIEYSSRVAPVELVTKKIF